MVNKLQVNNVNMELGLDIGCNYSCIRHGIAVTLNLSCSSNTVDYMLALSADSVVTTSRSTLVVCGADLKRCLQGF